MRRIGSAEVTGPIPVISSFKEARIYVENGANTCFFYAHDSEISATADAQSTSIRYTHHTNHHTKKGAVAPSFRVAFVLHVYLTTVLFRTARALFSPL